MGDDRADQARGSSGGCDPLVATRFQCLVSRVRREDHTQLERRGSDHAGPLTGANTAAQRQVRRSGTPRR